MNPASKRQALQLVWGTDILMARIGIVKGAMEWTQKMTTMVGRLAKTMPL